MRGTPLRPLPMDPDLVVHRFHRGKQTPRGVAWFGVRSFWGHFRHFIASAIATEDVDSRDWMCPDDPQKLVDRIARQLGAPLTGEPLVDCLKSDLWIDFIADTGDDASVSHAVARGLFQTYELPDPDRPGHHLLAPVGDILLFGGDIAYPVATGEEIHNRVIVPFNRVLEQVSDGRSRVLLAIPGNHDWYDGLDGFGRMFRRRYEGDDDELRPSVVQIRKRPLEHYADWAKEFVRGGQVDKPRALVLYGYNAVQRASYFAMPLSSQISLVAADRQLKQLDYRQRRFFRDVCDLDPDSSRLLVLPDPVRAFGRPSATSTGMIEALSFDVEHHPHLVLSGDLHHYQRWQSGASTHVIAGGGGAFLHPNPVHRAGVEDAQVEWPSGRQSRALLRSVPWQMALGRAGFLPHMAYLLLLGPSLYAPGPEAMIAVGVITSLVYALIGGVRRSRRAAPWIVAIAAGGWTAALAFAASRLALGLVMEGVPSLLAIALALGLIAFVGAASFGYYLALLTRLGLENTQAFTALDHPGFKHFVRLRVRQGGDTIDVWCVGLIDPLDPNATPVLVDSFKWRCDERGPPTAGQSATP